MDYLFFKVFKNIVLFKKIFSFIKHDNYYSDFGIRKLGSFRYEEIVSTNWMIKNQYYQLLFEKVKKKEYLLFNVYKTNKPNEIYEPRNEIRKKYDKKHGINIYLNKFSIFNKKIAIDAKWLNNNNNNNNNNGFYYYLFKNYSNYFIENENIKETEFFAIEYDNSHILEILSKEFNYKFKFISLQRSIDIGSFDCATIIYQQLLLNNKLGGGSGSSSGSGSGSGNKSKLIKLWNLFLSNENYNLKYNKVSSNGKYNFKFYETINFLINLSSSNNIEDLLPSLNKINNANGMFEFSIHNSTLLQLFESVKILVILRDLLKPFQKLINEKKLKLSLESDNEFIIERMIFNSTTMELPTKSDLQLMKFTNEQLNSLVSKFDNNNNNNVEDTNVFKLYNWLLPFTGFFTFFPENYIYLKLKYFNEFSWYKNQFLLSGTYHPNNFAHYDFQLLLQQTSENKYYFKLPIFIFSKSNRKSQISYLNNFINDIKIYQNVIPSEKKQLVIRVSINFFLDILRINDLELLKLFLENKDTQWLLIHFFDSSTSTIFKDIYYNINSIDSLDLIMKYININQPPPLPPSSSGSTSTTTTTTTTTSTTTTLLYSLVVNDKFEILSYYKKFHSNNYFKDCESFKLDHNIFTNNNETLKFIYNNLDDFDFDNVNIWRIDDKKCLNNLNDYIYFLDRTPFDVKYHCCIPGSLQGLISKNNNIYFNYIYNYRPLDLLNGRCVIFKGLKNNEIGKNTYYYIKLYQLKIKLNYNNNNNNCLIENNFNKLSILEEIAIICEEIGIYGNVKMVDELFKNSQDKLILMENIFFFGCCKFGQLKIYNYLIEKYNNILLTLFSNLNNIYKLGFLFNNGNLHLFLLLKSNLHFKLKHKVSNSTNLFLLNYLLK
ncbi:hypothetical protein ACTFIW_003549 [Dictyostelium discoideum]